MRLKTLVKYEVKRVMVFEVLAVIASIACVFWLNHWITNFLNRDPNLFWKSIQCGSVIPYYADYIQKTITIPVLIGLVIMVIAQSTYTKRGRTCEFMKSLPVKSEKWFSIRYLVGVAVITIPVILATVGAYILRFIYFDRIAEENALSEFYQEIRRNDNIWAILLGMVMFWLLMVTVYSILMFIQMLVNHRIVGSILGLFSLGFPYWIMFSYELFQERCMNVVPSYGVSTPFEWIMYWFATFFTGEQSYHIIVFDKGRRDVGFIFYDYMFLRMFLWIACIAIFFIAAFLLTKKRNLSQDNSLFYNKIVEKVYTILLGVFAAATTSLLFMDGMPIAALVVSTLVGVLVCILATKLLKRYHK